MKLYTEVYLLLLALTISVDYLLYKQSKKRILINKIFCFLPTLLFFAGFTWVRFFYKQFSDPQLPLIIMWFNMFYLLVYIPKIIFIVGNFLKFKAQINKLTINLFQYLFILVFLYLMYYGSFVTPNRITTTNVEIKLQNLPTSFNNYKVVQFSDVHLGSRPNNKQFYKNIVTEINKQDADIVVFTGDMVNNFSSEMYGFDSIFLQIKAKDGKFAVLGNHDYGDYTEWKSPVEKRENLNQIKAAFVSFGFQLLNNESVNIKRGNDSIALVGVENFSKKEYKNYANLPNALKDVENKMFKVLLSHNPEHWEREVLNKTNIDLTLSGHTHAAQMGVELNGNVYSPAVFLYKQYNGLYEKNNQYIYVSRGIGYIGLPLLVGLSPEISVINFRHK